VCRECAESPETIRVVSFLSRTSSAENSQTARFILGLSRGQYNCQRKTGSAGSRTNGRHKQHRNLTAVHRKKIIEPHETDARTKLFSYLQDFFRQNDCQLTFECEAEIRAEIRKCTDAVRTQKSTAETSKPHTCTVCQTPNVTDGDNHKCRPYGD